MTGRLIPIVVAVFTCMFVIVQVGTRLDATSGALAEATVIVAGRPVCFELTPVQDGVLASVSYESSLIHYRTGTRKMARGATPDEAREARFEFDPSAGISYFHMQSAIASVTPDEGRRRSTMPGP